MLTTTATALPAAADDGRWYLDSYNIPTAHADGYTGEGVTVAILDSPINMELPTLANADITVHEPSYCRDEETGEELPATSTDISGRQGAFHGTNMAAHLVGTGDAGGVEGVAPGVTLLHYTVSQGDGVVAGGENIVCFDEDGFPAQGAALNDAMNQAMDDGADVISISSGYAAGEFFDDAYPRAMNEGVIVLGSVSNTNDLMIGGWAPGGANGAVGVEAGEQDGTVKKVTEPYSGESVQASNMGTRVVGPSVAIRMQGTRDEGDVKGSWDTVVSNGGTSTATPIVAGFIALAWQKYPEATGNQMIQTLIHNTGVGGHPDELFWNENSGFGLASATSMLEVDPTRYPDVNPLLTQGEYNGYGNVNIPGYDEILDPAGPPSDEDERTEADPTAEYDEEQVESGIGVMQATVVAVGIVLGLLFVGALTVGFVFVFRRRGRALRAEAARLQANPYGQHPPPPQGPPLPPPPYGP